MTGQWSLEEAYAKLMSATPYTQSSSSAMIRNFGSAAQLMAAQLRASGANAADAGDAGAAMQQQAQLHAGWFDTVAANSADAGNKIDALVSKGNTHQATAEEVNAGYQQTVANDSSGSMDMAVIHQGAQGSQTLSAAVNDWGSSYTGLTMPAVPPVPTAGGAHGSSSGGPSNSPAYSGGSASGGTPSSVGSGAVAGGGLVLATGAGIATRGTSTSSGSGAVVDRGAGGPGSVEVGSDGGEFAGWFKDPRTGFYVDPATGREYDPTTSRWIDPVTGQPFGAVTHYATQLQGVGGPSLSGGLLGGPNGSIGGAGGIGNAAGGIGGAGRFGSGGAGGFPGLFSSGDTAAAAAGYGGVVPPSLANGSAAAGNLWQQAGRSLAVRQQTAAAMVGREQAARSGRPYLPPTQAGSGAGGGGGRGRPGYLSADEDEQGLFSSRGRRAGSAEAAFEDDTDPSATGGARSTSASTAVSEDEAQSAGGRRAYLPGMPAGGKGEDDHGEKRNRPDWLREEDVFTAGIENPPGILGE